MTRPACEGAHNLYGALIDSPHDPRIRRDAAEVCSGCDLRSSCLTEYRHEEWAQAVTRELRSIANGEPRGRRRGPSKCGTESGYTHHRRVLHDIPCDDCKAAHTAAEADRKYARTHQVAS